MMRNKIHSLHKETVLDLSEKMEVDLSKNMEVEEDIAETKS